MSERPTPPPEGRIITEALKKARLSAREAARRADISEGRWRQIASGYQKVGQIYAQVRGPADTMARMARVVGARPEDFEAVERSDIAVAMREQEAEGGSEQDEVLAGFDFANFVPTTDAEKVMVALAAALARERENNADLTRRLSQVEERLDMSPPAEEGGNPSHDRDERRRGA